MNWRGNDSIWPRKYSFNKTRKGCTRLWLLLQNSMSLATNWSMNDSPDEATNDYFSFLSLKKWFGENRFGSNDEEVKNLQKRWTKCRSSNETTRLKLFFREKPRFQWKSHGVISKVVRFITHNFQKDVSIEKSIKIRRWLEISYDCLNVVFRERAFPCEFLWSKIL